MSASGPAIFSDDFACDVREAYRDLLAEGCSAQEVYNRLMREFKGEITDSDDGPVFWLALAKSQWDYGRLDERVKAKALKLIDDGTALSAWIGLGGSPRRQAVLTKLREQMVSPQPRLKKIRSTLPWFEETTKDWPLGEVIAYQLPSGRYILLHVVGADEGGPTVAVLDWIGTRIPPPERIQQLSLKSEPHDWKPSKMVPYLIGLLRKREKELPAERLTWLSMSAGSIARRTPGRVYTLFYGRS